VYKLERERERERDITMTAYEVHIEKRDIVLPVMITTILG
jgi:hypothetical protein